VAYSTRPIFSNPLISLFITSFRCVWLFVPIDFRFHSFRRCNSGPGLQTIFPEGGARSVSLGIHPTYFPFGNNCFFQRFLPPKDLLQLLRTFFNWYPLDPVLNLFVKPPSHAAKKFSPPQSHGLWDFDFAFSPTTRGNLNVILDTRDVVFFTRQ